MDWFLGFQTEKMQKNWLLQSFLSWKQKEKRLNLGKREKILPSPPFPLFHPNDSVRYYAGTAVYLNHFELTDAVASWPTTLRLDSLHDIATVRINGIDCGTIWAAPFQTDISHALRPGLNRLEIEVTNTWHNRLLYDETLPEGRRLTWTTAPFRLKGKPLLPAGLGSIPVFLRPIPTDH